MTELVFVMIGVLMTLGLVQLHARTMGFRAQVPADYAGKGPLFDLRTHLNGPLQCEGVIYGPTGVLTERFHYDSGTVQDRQWTLTLGNDGRIRAVAPDVVGTGEGQAEGSAVQLRYDIRLTPEAGGHVLSVVDWMYLTENGTIINRSQFRKFGIKVAELVATMRKKPA
jgi:hypothetical protein